MIARLCQLKTLGICTLIFMSGCSLFKPKEEKVHRPERNFKISWFKENPRHSLLDQQREAKPHLFLDLVTLVDPEKRTVDVFIETPAHSEHIYQIDAVSGQRHYLQSMCPQKDVWGTYKKSIEKNHFSVGIIPRHYDQLGAPQKVVIFGDSSESNINFNSKKIRLVSAFVEQTCRDNLCAGDESWLSKLIFVGVDTTDSKFANITNPTELQTKIDWPYTKATLENMYGVNGSSTNPIGKIKVGQLLIIGEALDYTSKRSIKLEEASLKKVQKGCHNLYEKFWKDVGEARLEDKATKDSKELNEKLKHIEKLKTQGKHVGFNHRLRKFVEIYHDQFSTCQKLVYSGNINENPEKFWFLSFMDIFIKMHTDGHHFDCRTNSWRENALNKFGEPMFSLKRDISDCSNANIDAAFKFLPNYLSTLRRNQKTHYRFVDYDYGAAGTHEKIYRWIKFNPTVYTCKNDPNQMILKKIKDFPEDASWIQRDAYDSSDSLKLIE